MISLDTFLQIRHQFHNEHREIPQIARNLGLDTKTIAKWAQQAKYVPRRAGHRQGKLDSFKPTIVKLVKEQGLSALHIYQVLREDGYTGGYSILKTFVSNERIGAPVTPKEFHAYRWMHRIMQGDVPLSELLHEFAGKLEHHDITTLTNHIQGGALRRRNKAVAILAFNKPISLLLISRYLLLDIRTVSQWRNQFRKGGIGSVCCSGH